MLLFWARSMEAIASTLNSWLVCRWGQSVNKQKVLQALSRSALMSVLGPIRGQTLHTNSRPGPPAAVACILADVLTRGLGFIGAIGFNGSSVVAILS